ncbi:MAG: ATP-dependent DNA helicase, partial [Oscillospiraceae bacterium]|nr:ATP-dependent DNA helicase [Oscillospiraceae bacterium]
TAAQKRQIGSIAGLLQGLQTILSDKRVFKNQDSLRLYVTQTVNKLIQRLDSLAAPGGYILWLELPKIESGSVTLNATPKQLDKRLYEDLWLRRIPAVLTSGTLSAAGNFAHFKKSLGLDRAFQNPVTELLHASPFDYEHHCLLYLADDLPFPDPKDPLYIDAVTKRVGRLIEATHGHTLVLFTSYRVMELVYLRLKGVFPFPFLKTGKGLINVVGQFRASGNGVLFAAGCWEGIDLPGDILSSLIVVKLPFPQPDPLSDYERSLYAGDREYIDSALIPQMLVKLKQGCGRLIRNEEDTGVISILDCRLKTGGRYRADVLRTLPKCGMADSVFDIARFIKKKKSNDYFRKGA